MLQMCWKACLCHFQGQETKTQPCDGLPAPCPEPEASLGRPAQIPWGWDGLGGQRKGRSGWEELEGGLAYAGGGARIGTGWILTPGLVQVSPTRAAQICASRITGADLSVQSGGWGFTWDKETNTPLLQVVS